MLDLTADTRMSVANRVREVAVGLTEPADIKAAEAYARGIEMDVLKERTFLMADPKRESG